MHRWCSRVQVITKRVGVVHRPVNIAEGQRVIGGIYHIQIVNAYDSRLKQWMVKSHGVATQYLESYLGWQRMIDRLGQNITPKACLPNLLEEQDSFNR